MTRVNLLFGFLGSGKTTLARRLLECRDPGEKTAVIVNEFGEVGIDGEILKGTSVDVVELTSGCLCCTLKGSLVLAVDELARQRGVERILVEATGLALPGDLVETLAIAVRKGVVEVGPIVTVVDALRFPKLLAGLGPFYADQVENADIVIVHKTDLVPPEAAFAVAARIREMNTEATILFAQRGDVDPARLFERPLRGVVARALESGAGREGGHDAGHAPGHGSDHGQDRAHAHDHGQGHHHDHDHDHDHGPGHGHHHGLVTDSFVLESTGTLDRAALEGYFASMPEFVWRAKGFLRLASGPHLVQYTLGQLEITPVERASREALVFIGQDMDRDTLAHTFAALSRD